MMEVFERERLGVLVFPQGSQGGLHSGGAGGERPGRNTQSSHRCQHSLIWDQSDHWSAAETGAGKFTSDPSVHCMLRCCKNQVTQSAEAALKLCVE